MPAAYMRALSRLGVRTMPLFVELEKTSALGTWWELTRDIAKSAIQDWASNFYVFPDKQKTQLGTFRDQVQEKLDAEIDEMPSDIKEELSEIATEFVNEIKKTFKAMLDAEGTVDSTTGYNVATQCVRKAALKMIKTYSPSIVS